MRNSKVVLPVVIGLILLTGLIIASSYIKSQFRTYDVRVGIGKKGDTGEQLITNLSELFIENDIPIKIIPIETEGSLENAELVQTGKADLGIAVLNAAKGSRLRNIALLYPQINHLVVRADSNINSLADLKGKRIATSSIGGGTYIALLSLLNYYNMTTEDVVLHHMSSSKFSKAFSDNEVDAVFYNDPPGSKRITEVLAGGHGKLLPMEDFIPLNMSDPFLEKYLIPEGLYHPANPKIPSRAFYTVGYQTAIIANASTDAFVIKTFLEFLFDYQSVIREKAPLISFLKKPTEEIFGPAFHPVAQDYYAEKKPSFFERYSNEINFTLTILPVLGSLLFAFKSKLQTKKTELMSHYHQEIQQALLALIETNSLPEIQAVETDLHRILSQFMQDQGQGKVNQEEESRFSFAWDKSMQLTKEKINTFR